MFKEFIVPRRTLNPTFNKILDSAQGRPFIDPDPGLRYNTKKQKEPLYCRGGIRVGTPVSTGFQLATEGENLLKRLFQNLRFRTRLALVMLLTLGCTSAILMASYVSHNRQIKAYVAGQTSELLQIVQLTQARIPPSSDRKQALDAYLKALKDAGLSSITLATPSGEVVASTNPSQVGKKIKLKKKRAAVQDGPIQISAELREIDIDPEIEQKPYLIEFPIVQGDRVLGYALVRGELDEMGEMLRRLYVVRLGWLLATMLAGMFAVVYLAFRFTKPIEDLVAGAERVAQGKLDVALPSGRTDEMGRLAQTFNRMVERLREGRALQERLSEAEKSSLLGRFAANVAHEVRNSLNFINLSIDQIRAKHTGGDERFVKDLERNLRNIKDEIGRLNQMVTEFLALGRQVPPRLEKCNLRERIEEVVALAGKQAARQGVAVELGLPAQLPDLWADRAQLKTCFLNILTNAIEALPQGGRIRITAHFESSGEGDGAGRLQIRFADNGPGIAWENREKVFTPYYSTKTTGFGLGLAITRKIVEDHGGRVYVADDGEPGTVMVVELPASSAPALQPTDAAVFPAA
jgi:nitrogen fixation/metabolism regulation signal transduction histidine kinase